ncbi:MAG: NfeD family protein [Oscillospiraceae bacterium]|nr:NfeD family protein [Oscillospiraceae bacterium]
MEWFSSIWENMDTIQKLLCCIAVPSSIVLILQTILILIGAGGGETDTGGIDGDIDTGDTGADADAGAGDFGIASMFTLQGIMSFLCVFGWVSLALYGSGIILLIALPIAFVSGFAIMYTLAKLMFYLTKLAQTGTLNVKNLLGSMGTVYLTIPPKGEGVGKVMVQTSERLVEFEAVTDEESDIPNNTKVRVIDILGENVLVVEKI